MPRLYLALAAVFFLAVAHGQIASTTSLVGTVTDESAKTIPGARILAVNQGSRDTYSALTNHQGQYSIQFIRVGTYNLTVERAQFQRVEKTGIVVENNAVVRN